MNSMCISGQTETEPTLKEGFGPGARVRLAADAKQRGSALAATLVVFVAVAGLVLAATQLSSIEVAASRRSVDDVRATSLAEAGVERAKAALADATNKTRVHDPLDGVRAMFASSGGVGSTAMTFDAEPMLDGAANVGEYTTSMTFEQDTPRSVIVRVTSTGYVPRAPQNLGPKEKLAAWDSVDVTLRYRIGSSEVFDNAYFVNNWGWLYGNTIDVNGNARSNGQMDIGGYHPTITGQTLYDAVNHDGTSASLGNALDKDGLFSGWDVVNDAGVSDGNGGAPDKHDFQDQVEMPNLTDLSTYEAMATSAGSSISIGGVQVSDGVAGDSAGENDNLYLHGTFANPIELTGPIVVRGDVIISGFVSGQGTIYSGGNVYVPDSVRYLDGPISDRPSGDDPAAVEAWLTQNWSKDFLGLFARENVVVGDFTNRNWQRYVGGWLASPLNASREDSGLDLIANTYAGRDGVFGTADDDFLEGDGQFSIEYYSADDASNGVIPAGYQIGDPIPGTGEDIDGDGQFDDTLTVADFAIDSPLDSGHWDGNMPASGVANYRDIASMYANHLDATFYTNHAFAWVVFGSQDAVLNGSMVARNESCVYGTPNLKFNYDSRLLGGGDGFVADMLPQTLRPLEVLQWRRNEEDPHRRVIP